MKPRSVLKRINNTFKSQLDKWTEPNPQDPQAAPLELDDNISTLSKQLLAALKHSECKDKTNCNICSGQPKDYFDIDFILTHGPGIYPVINFVNQLVFACDLQVYNGDVVDEQATKKLVDYLQNKNFMNIDNLTTLQTAVFNSLAYGESLLRFTDEGLVNYTIRKYVVATEKNARRGVRKALYYIVDLSDKQPDFKQTIKTPDSLLDENGNLIPNFVDAMFTDTQDQNKFILTFDEAIQLRYSDSSDYYAPSPLLYDRYRLSALLTGYRSLVNDLAYDNFGKVLAFLREDLKPWDLLGMNEREYKANLSENTKKVKEVIQSALRTASQIHSSTERNAFGYLNGQIFDKMETVKGSVDMSKYLGLLGEGINYAAVTYQINPRLIDSEAGLGQNLTPLLRLTYDNTINAVQRKMANQFTQLLKANGVVADNLVVKFDQRDLDDPEQNAKIQKIVSETAKNLAASGVDLGQVYSYISESGIPLDSDGDSGERFIDRSLTILGAVDEQNA